MAGSGELAILGSGDGDATMTDIGEKGRPPGDPLDPVTFWAQKVIGRVAGGGLLTPESVLDEGFVVVRLKLDFRMEKLGNQ